MQKRTWEMPAELKHLADLRQFVEDFLNERGVSVKETEDIIQAVDECATNIIQHGYRGRLGKIEAQIGLEGDKIVVRLKDQARRFDPTQAPAPDVSSPLEQRRPGGLGIFLTRHFVDEMIYHAPPEGGNELYLKKKVSGGKR